MYLYVPLHPVFFFPSQGAHRALNFQTITLGRAMRAHQAKDRDKLTHEDVYGPGQLKADMVNTVCASFGTNLLPLPAAGFQASSPTTRESQLVSP